LGQGELFESLMKRTRLARACGSAYEPGFVANPRQFSTKNITTTANENVELGDVRTVTQEKTKFAEREGLGSVIRVVIHTLLPTGTV
jgi:hypothetical protein